MKAATPIPLPMNGVRRVLSTRERIAAGFFLRARERSDVDDLESAERLYRRAIEICPAFPAARAYLASALLGQGRYAQGWPFYSPLQMADVPPPCQFPRWLGQPVAGRSILLLCDGGLGDNIQFVRYAPLLKQRGASRVTIVGKPILMKLFAHIEGIDNTIGAKYNTLRVPTHDYYSMLGDLPLHFRTEIDSIPDRVPYLRAPLPAPPLPDAPLRVGLCWHTKDPLCDRRSLDSLAQLSPLWRVPGVSFVCLQHDTTPAETRADLGDVAFHHLRIHDFVDLAAAISGLDLVITVDTSVAHLAGALGVPTWVLLPFPADWRWLRDRTDSVWYPNVMRLFRQRRAGAWEGVIEEVATALLEISQHRPMRELAESARLGGSEEARSYRSGDCDAARKRGPRNPAMIRAGFKRP